jgi:[ribosomal protein S5]-alanine N-acetyltransferase
MKTITEPAVMVNQGTRLHLRRASMDDQHEFTELAAASKNFHEPWIYAPATATEFAQYMRYYSREDAEFLLLCRRESGVIAGFVTISDMVGAPYWRAVVGYGVFAPSRRRGYMLEGLKLAVQFVFEHLGLHRLEADIQPANEASVAFIRRAGFRYEGFSPGFIQIGGRWHDHERWAITADMVSEALETQSSV